MNQFLGRYSLLKLPQGKTDNLNRSVSTKYTEYINNLPKRKATGSEGFTGEFYQIL